MFIWITCWLFCIWVKLIFLIIVKLSTPTPQKNFTFTQIITNSISTKTKSTKKSTKKQVNFATKCELTINCEAWHVDKIQVVRWGRIVEEMFQNRWRKVVKELLKKDKEELLRKFWRKMRKINWGTVSERWIVDLELLKKNKERRNWLGIVEERERSDRICSPRNFYKP